MKATNEVRYWLNEIEDAKKRDEDYVKMGEKILDIYNSENPEDIPFNILYSNTETLHPALYSKLPRPAIKPRTSKKDKRGFTKVDILDTAVCSAANRMITYLLDMNTPDYASADSSFSAAVLDALLPGRGATSVKFDSEGTDEEVDWATVCLNTRKWNRVYYGFATKWEDMPWIAYEEFMDEDEARKMFKGKAGKIKFTISDEDEHTESEYEERVKTARIYQIWDKNKKKIIYISDSCAEVLREDDDPLKIDGFYNMPKPLSLHKRSNDLRVTALYSLYENQATELNRISRRINRVVEAIKVRGAYNGALGADLERIFEVDDTELVATENATMLEQGGFEKNIWLIPVGELVGVLQNLFVSREACKSVIYEITGISDILRGSSRASETLGAQKMKEAWGTMRLKNLQKAVQTYARDVIRIMLDVAAKNMPQSMWVKITGLPYPTKEEKQKAVDLMNKLKQQMAQMQATQQKPSDKMQKEAEELKALLSMPTWETILGALQDDFQRSYSVDIETNSTLDANATEDKKEISEFMNAMAQFMNGIMPMVQSKTLPFGAAKSWLLDIASRYGFGDDVVDEIRAMQEPKSVDPEKIKDGMKKLNDAKKKLEAERQKFQQEQQKVGDVLDKEFSELHKQKLDFEYEKKTHEQSVKFSNLMLKAQGEIDNAQSKTEVESIITKHKREVQSMMDKQIKRIETAIEQA